MTPILRGDGSLNATAMAALPPFDGPYSVTPKRSASRNQYGGKIIDEYYRLAPAIVRKVNDRPDHQEVFAALFGQIEKAVQLIRASQYAEAFAHYVDVVKRLQKEYMGIGNGYMLRPKFGS